MRIPLLSVMAVALLVPSVAFAQGSPPWTGHVKTGETLSITLVDGEKIEGTVVRAVSQALELATREGVRPAPYSRIREVRRRDKLRNGILIGAAIGLVLGSVPLVYGNECSYETCGGQLGLPLGAAFVGGLIGGGVDAAIKGWTTIHPTRGGVGIRAALSW